MKMLVLDGCFITGDIERVFDNKNSLEKIYDEAKKNNFDRYILVQRGAISTVPEGIKNVIVRNFKPKDILGTILDESRNCEDIVIFDAGNPFYDAIFVDEMLLRHRKYLADFTYTIGYPEGLTPKIVKKEILKEIIKLVETDNSIQVDYLYYSLSKDINSFDIETFLSDIDLRLFRIKFGANDRGEEIFTKNIYNKLKSYIKVDDLVKFLSENISELFTIPYLVTFELNNFSENKSIYSLIDADKSIFFNTEILKKTVSDLKKINDKITIILGGRGEVFDHPDVFEIINFIINNDLRLIIETSGITKVENLVEKLNLSVSDKTNFHVVIRFDAYEQETFRKIHPSIDFLKIKILFQELKDNNYKVYKEIIRMIENEVEIEKYIRNKESDDIIIRKFSTYCGKLDDRKVVDLSPFERTPCFHLRREIYIKSNMDVSICQFNQDKIIGNLVNDSLEDVIGVLKGEYDKNVKKDYHDFCKICDDYYIFNF